MKPEKPFFVGYLAVPPGLKRFLLLACAVLLAGSAALGYAIGATQDDPGPQAIRFDYGRQTVTGVVELTPAPVLHVTQGTDQVPAGHTLMLAGQGKNGAIDRAAEMDGKLAQASGVLLERGALDMLQLRGGGNGLALADGPAPPVPEPEQLGRWRLAGEICDGKCLTGAMRPGRGLSHRACANLCLLGDVPAVFVASQPVEGETFFLIAGADGGSLPDALYDYVALYITLEGEIARHGDLPVLRVDLATVELAD